MIGERLGPYEIQGRLGSGGMGEVFLGHDSRLGRQVAIKVLPPEASKDSVMVERFRREARAISALSHPHICALYDVGQHEGRDYLVMERLEGQTLADRLQAGALPMRQALDLAGQMADALVAAHRRGIVHRDLKPGNVMLTPSGAKLLDFGLAKLQAQPAVLEGGAPTQAMTAVAPLTGEGTLMGTFQYMAPEQFEGAEVDHRADIFAFGAILYEMLTGSRAFAGASPASLIGAIMHTEPGPISDRQPLSGRALERIVRKCLAKQPDQRWQDAGDLRDELRWVAEEPLDQPEQGLRPAGSWAWTGWATALLLAIAGGTGWWLAPGPVEPPAPILANISVPEEVLEVGVPVLSPDGQVLVFEADDHEGRRQLWLRHLGSALARPIIGTEGGSQPFFSPDGRSLGFFAGGALKRLDLDGGRLMTLFEGTTFGASGSWSGAGIILFTPGIEQGLLRLADTGGAATPVTFPDRDQASFGHAWPHWLKDDRHFLFVLVAGERAGIHLGAIDEAESTLIVSFDGLATTGVRHAPGGRIVYLRNGDLFAQQLDLDQRRVLGEPVRVAEGIRFHGPGHAAFSISDNGHLVYLEDAGWSTWQIIWRDRNGEEVELVGTPGPFLDERLPTTQPRLSPDGRWLALARRAPKAKPNLWLLDMRRGNLLPFADRAYASAPVWSPLSNELAFGEVFQGPPAVKLKTMHGPAQQRALLTNGAGLAPERWPSDWSASGHYLLYMQQEADTSWDLHLVDLREEVPISRPYTQMTAAAQLGRISPDERWVAYASNLSGRYEIHLSGFPDHGRHWQVSDGMSGAPFWSADSSEIFYPDRSGALMRVRIELDVQGEPELSVPEQLHPGPGPSAFAVSDDGERFLALRKVSDPPMRPYILMLNGLR